MTMDDGEKLVKEMMEYASLEKIYEEQGQTCVNQVRPFPVEIPIEVRHHEHDDRKYNFRSQTMHDFPRLSFEQLDLTIDIKGVVKIISEGTTKKVAKNQVLRIYQDQMILVNDKGEEEMFINSLLQTSYKSTSKKEITITRAYGETPKTYKLQFDSTKDLNLAVVDLEQYYGFERPNFYKINNNEEKSQIRYKLLKLLGKRSSKDLLEKKGIIKNEPIFGNTLRHLCEMYDQVVPAFMSRIIQLIELPSNITSTGLYRASGNLATIQKIRFNIDKNNLKILEEFKNDIDVLTGSLKLFFRELQEPLIPHKIYEELCKFLDCEIGPKEIEIIKGVINKMETSHKNTLMTLLKHLLVVESYSEQNKMDFYNISIVWGPTLMWPPENFHENILVNHTNSNKTVELLLNVYKKVFSSTNKNEPSSRNGSFKENGAAIQDKNGNKTFMQELNENITLGLRKTTSKDNLMKSSDSLPKTPDKEFKYDLEQLCSHSKEKIPEFVLKVVPFVEKGINSEFLYKKSASTEKLEKIKKKIAKSRCNWNTLDKYNIHELAGALKHFFLELKAPLIPKDIFKRLLFASDERIEVTKLRNVKRELSNSYIPQQETLDYLMKHLVNVSRHEESNKMSKHNIAMEWSPVICRTFIENHEISLGSCIHVFDTLLQIYDNKTVINMDLEKDNKHNNDVYNRIYLQTDNQLSKSPEKQADYLGQTPDSPGYLNVTGNQVLPPVVKRKPKIQKNDSSLHRVSRFITNTLSLYDNVQLPYVDDIKDEATILEDTPLKSNKTMENSTKL